MRQKEQKERYQAANKGQLSHVNCAALFQHVWQSTVGKNKPVEDYNYLYSLLMDPEFGIMDNLFADVISRCPSLLKASKSKSDPDTPSMQEALNGPYRDEFLEAMQVEIKELEEHGTWEMLAWSSLPEGANVLQGTWAFKVKQYPDGRFRKTKA